jgi:hypothetical protein
MDNNVILVGKLSGVVQLFFHELFCNGVCNGVFNGVCNGVCNEFCRVRHTGAGS